MKAPHIPAQESTAVRPSACLVSGADEIRLRSYINHAIYARTHGLDYRLERGIDRGITNKFFYKTSIIRRVLPLYEWLIWIDDDAYFTDFSGDNSTSSSSRPQRDDKSRRVHPRGPGPDVVGPRDVGTDGGCGDR